MISLDLLLPFFFVLAIVYGSLEVSKIFENQRVKALISLVVAFFSITSQQVVEFIGFILPYAAFFFVGFFFLGFVVSFFKQDKSKEKRDPTMLIVILALVVIFFASGQGLGIVDFQDQNFLGVLVLLAIILIIYVAYSKERATS